MKKSEQIAECAYTWYQANKRELPFRKTKEPYKIWLSEVMSQQTQLERVIPYYERFLNELPTIQSLADADEEKILKLWEGLGYYSRVRNMQSSAQYIMQECSGKFPTTYDEILKLTGVGPYIAGAIAGICFNERVSAVDGNVLRVFTRLFEIHDDIREQKTIKHIQRLAQETVQVGEVGEINQAYIELGALICTPKNPKCLECPLITVCKANQSQTVGVLPYKSPSKKQKEYDLVACIVEDPSGNIFVEQREMALLNQQWQFPMEEKELPDKKLVAMLEKKLGVTLEVMINQEEVKPIRHVFSHQVWNITPRYFKTKKIFNENQILKTTTHLITAHKKILEKAT